MESEGDVAEFAHTGQHDVRLDVWAKGTVIGILIAAPAGVLGLTAKVNPIDTENMDDWDADVGLQVFLPVLIWYIIANKVTGTVAYYFGKDMLQECNADIKEAVRSNMTTTGVVLALVLTIVIAMLQTDVPFEDDSKRTAMWYRIVLVLSIESCLKGILMSCFFLVYMEPLSPSAAKAFTVDNVNYLGEPFTGVVLSLVYFLFSMVLWMYGRDGFFMGLAVTAVFAFIVIRSVVVLLYMNCWKNPEIKEQTRENREKFFSGLYTVVAKKPSRAQQQT